MLARHASPTHRTRTFILRIYRVSRNDILMSGLCVTAKQTTAARDQSQRHHRWKLQWWARGSWVRAGELKNLQILFTYRASLTTLSLFLVTGLIQIHSARRFQTYIYSHASRFRIPASIRSASPNDWRVTFSALKWHIKHFSLSASFPLPKLPSSLSPPLLNPTLATSLTLKLTFFCLCLTAKSKLSMILSASNTHRETQTHRQHTPGHLFLQLCDWNVGPYCNPPHTTSISKSWLGITKVVSWSGLLWWCWESRFK